MLLTLPTGHVRGVSEKIRKTFLEKFWELGCKDSGDLFQPIGVCLTACPDFGCDCILRQTLLTKLTDLNSFRHQFLEPGKKLF